jgi:2-oxoglutarate ferredoxin oxidoreductase subunit alpha
MKNIMYVGALTALLGIDNANIEPLIEEQFGRKPTMLEANKLAMRLGREYVEEHLPEGIGLQVRPADHVGDRIFVDGNAAAGLGLVYGGATVCAWYPITPSTSVVESFQRYAGKFRVDPETGQNRVAVVQA